MGSLMVTLLQIFWTVCQWKKKLLAHCSQICDEDIGKNVDVVSRVLTNGVMCLCGTDSWFAVKVSSSSAHQWRFVFWDLFMLVFSQFLAMLLWLQVIFVMLSIAEVDSRRIAYLCESVQEELKLESSYKKVWVSCKLCDCISDSLWLMSRATIC